MEATAKRILPDFYKNVNDQREVVAKTRKIGDVVASGTIANGSVATMKVIGFVVEVWFAYSYGPQTKEIGWHFESTNKDGSITSYGKKQMVYPNWEAASSAKERFSKKFPNMEFCFRDYHRVSYSKSTN